MYERVILTDIEFSDSQNLDQALWKNVFYQVIERFRQLLRDSTTDDESRIKKMLLTLLDEVELCFPEGFFFFCVVDSVFCPFGRGTLFSVVFRSVERIVGSLIEINAGRSTPSGVCFPKGVVFFDALLQKLQVVFQFKLEDYMDGVAIRARPLRKTVSGHFGKQP